MYIVQFGCTTAINPHCPGGSQSKHLLGDLLGRPDSDNQLRLLSVPTQRYNSVGQDQINQETYNRMYKSNFLCVATLPGYDGREQLGKIIRLLGLESNSIFV